MLIIDEYKDKLFIFSDLIQVNTDTWIFYFNACQLSPANVTHWSFKVDGFLPKELF